MEQIIPVQSSAELYSAVQCSAVQYSALQCLVVLCSVVQCNEFEFSCVQLCAVQYSAVQCVWVQWSAVDCSAVRSSVVQCNTVQCGAQCSAGQCVWVQCSAVECSAVQCSAVQYGGQFSCCQGGLSQPLCDDARSYCQAEERQMLGRVYNFARGCSANTDVINSFRKAFSSLIFLNNQIVEVDDGPQLLSIIILSISLVQNCVCDNLSSTLFPFVRCLFPCIDMKVVSLKPHRLHPSVLFVS